VPDEGSGSSFRFVIQVRIVMAAGQDQPGWLHWWFQLWHRIVARSPDTFGYTTAVLETLIAIGLILGLARGSTYILGAIVSIGIWAVAEGFGGCRARKL